MADQFEIELHWLKCHESEDTFGDEVLMVVLADDDPRRTFRKGDVDDGETWRLNHKPVDLQRSLGYRWRPT